MPDVPPVRTFATAVPTERMLEVNIDETKFNLQPLEQLLVYGNLDPNTGNVITGVTYNALALDGLTDQNLSERFGSYNLTAAENRYSGYTTLLFSLNKNSTQANTAVSTNVETVSGHYWHPILLHLDFLPVTYGYTQTTFNSSGTQGVQAAQRYLVRQRYIPGTSEGTRKITRVFQSSTPFQIPQWESPVPTEVSFHYINLSGGFPSCLHKRLALEDLLGSLGFSGPASSSNPYYELIAGQVFPATNFLTWEPYILDDGQKLVNGVWTRTQIEVIPPDPPKAIEEIS